MLLYAPAVLEVSLYTKDDRPSRLGEVTCPRFGPTHKLELRGSCTSELAHGEVVETTDGGEVDGRAAALAANSPGLL
jgi:hypothetical protein